MTAVHPATLGLWSQPAPAPHGETVTQHITALSPTFPAALRGVVPELWARGAAAAWQAFLGGQAADLTHSPRITVVGSRAASEAGLRRAHELGAALATAGAIVLSGGALGIDGAAHQGALAAGGQTWAILGSGLDNLYPQRHLPLFAQVLQAGLLLSPFAPPSPPRAGHFPKRNQVMAALADMVVVIEASLASGTRYTAEAASRMGRRVLCFPGSPGTEALIKGGAQAVRSVADVLAWVSAPQAGPHPTGAPDPIANEGGAEEAPPSPSIDLSLLSPASAHLFRILGEPTVPGSGYDTSELTSLSGLSAADCAAALIELELNGCCSRLPGGRYIQRASL